MLYLISLLFLVFGRLFLYVLYVLLHICVYGDCHSSLAHSYSFRCCFSMSAADVMIRYPFLAKSRSCGICVSCISDMCIFCISSCSMSCSFCVLIRLSGFVLSIVSVLRPVLAAMVVGLGRIGLYW